MYLDIIEAIREFFLIFQKFSLGNLLILSGELWFHPLFLIYLVIVVSSFRKEEKNLIASKLRLMMKN